MMQIEARREKLELDCPVCGVPMKVNMDFQIAKCMVNGCEFWLNWSSVIQRTASILRLSLRLRGLSPIKVARVMEMIHRSC